MRLGQFWISPTFDDSADENTFALGGYIAPIKVWDRVSREWSDVCKEKPRIKYFRTFDALCFKQCFCNFNKESRNSKILRLAKTIPDRNIYAIASYLSKSDFNEISKGSYPPGYDNPYFLCAAFITIWLGINCETLFPQTIDKQTGIDFIFDEQGKIGRKFKSTIFDPFLKRMFPRLRRCEFWNDREFPPLQAADMYAAWIRRQESTIQIWNAADVFLSRIKLKPLQVGRRFLEAIRDNFRDLPHVRALLPKIREVISSIREEENYKIK